jgi:retron-type reverse transcriptase
MFLSFRQDSEIGTVQGSVLSPLLYNIYFHEFEKYIVSEFERIIQQINKNKNRKNKTLNKLYNSLREKKNKIGFEKKITGSYDLQKPRKH